MNDLQKSINIITDFIEKGTSLDALGKLRKSFDTIRDFVLREKNEAFNQLSPELRIKQGILDVADNVGAGSNGPIRTYHNILNPDTLSRETTYAQDQAYPNLFGALRQNKRKAVMRTIKEMNKVFFDENGEFNPNSEVIDKDETDYGGSEYWKDITRGQVGESLLDYLEHDDSSDEHVASVFKELYKHLDTGEEVQENIDRKLRETVIGDGVDDRYLRKLKKRITEESGVDLGERKREQSSKMAHILMSDILPDILDRTQSGRSIKMIPEVSGVNQHESDSGTDMPDFFEQIHRAVESDPRKDEVIDELKISDKERTNFTRHIASRYLSALGYKIPGYSGSSPSHTQEELREALRGHARSNGLFMPASAENYFDYEKDSHKIRKQ